MSTYYVYPNSDMLSRGRTWSLVRAHMDGRPTWIGTYKTRKSAMVAGRLLAGWSGRVLPMKRTPSRVRGWS